MLMGDSPYLLTEWWLKSTAWLFVCLLSRGECESVRKQSGSLPFKYEFIPEVGLIL